MPELARFAVVTGASSGIGRELARCLAEDGHDLLLVADDVDVHLVAAELPGEARALQVDLATREGNEQVERWIEESGRRLCAAVVNAGFGVGGHFVDTDLDADLRLVGVNVASTVHLTKVFARLMADEGEGRLLLTSSVASQLPGPGNATYAASKAFVQSFAQALRRELRPAGVTVTTLLPGPTDTAFFRAAGMGGTWIEEGPKAHPAEVARAGYRGMVAGRAQVVPGLETKAQVLAGRVLPDAAGAWVHGAMNSRAPRWFEGLRSSLRR